MKKILTISFLLFVSHYVSGQITNKPGPANLTASAWECSDAVNGSCLDDCTHDWSYVQHGWLYAGTYYYDNFAYGSGTFDMSLSVGSYVISSVHKTVNFYTNGLIDGGGFGCGYSGITPGTFGTVDGSVTINVVADLAATSSVPSSICQGNTLNLYSYINKASGATFYVDGSNIGTSTFNASSFSVGSHTVSASYAFNNGTTTVGLGSITVLSQASVTANPSAGSQCPGAGVSFSANGSGSGISFQWQESTNGGSSWSNLSNAGVYSGVTTSTLSISNVTGKGGNQYRMVITGSCSTVTTSATILTVYGQVGITASPSNQTVCPTNSASFSAGGTPHNGSLLFQWQESTNGGSSYSNLSNGGVYSGVTTSTLTLTGVTSAMNGRLYRCVLSDACGSVNQNVTSTGTLSVYGNVTVTTNPSNKSVCPLGSTTFSSNGTAQNGSLSLQWQYWNGSSYSNLSNTTLGDGTIVSGVTTSTLSMSNIASAENGLIVRCVLSDACGSATSVGSSTATLTVYGNVSITAQPSNQTVCPGTNAVYSIGASGPNGSLSYQWQQSTNSGSSYSNLSNDASHTGVTTATLVLVNVTSAWSGSMSSLRYRCVVSDACGSVTQTASSGATLALYGQVPITVQPTNKLICPNSNATFSVTSSAQTGSLTFNWEQSTDGGSTYTTISNSGIYSGATTATLILTGATTSFNNYKYRVKVTDGCGSINQNTSSVATLTMYTPVAINTQPSNKTICPNTSTSFTIGATASNGSLSFQWQESTNGGTSFSNLSNAGLYSGVTIATLTLTNAPNTMANYRYRCVVSDACGSVNQTISNAGILSFNTNASISTQPSNETGCVGGNVNFTVSALGTGLTYQWQESTNGGTSFTNLTNTGIYTGTSTATLTLTGLTAAFDTRRYRVIVTGTCNSVTSSGGVLSVIVPPSITTDPSASTVCEQSSSSFTIVANGTSLTYQWQFSATGGTGSFSDIASATSSTYTNGTTTLSNAGYYRCVVNNGCASGTPSGSALLTVNPLTVIGTSPTDQYTCPGMNATFSVVASGTGTLSYQWQKSIDGGSTFNDISGATSSSLVLSAVSSSSTNNRFKVKVSGACGTIVTSSVAILTVNPTPVAPTAANVDRCGDGAIQATATSPAPTPTFKWYVNDSDIVPVFTGTTYAISNLTVTAQYHVSVTSLGCESSKTAVLYTHYSPQNVPLGNTLTLCIAQGLYALDADITDNNAKGSNFTWTANGTDYTSKNFDPSVGTGSYTVSYDPPTAAKATPYCYIPTTRTVQVISSTSGGINFADPLISNGNTVNLCIGDSPIDISTFPSVSGGSWSTVTGNGLSFSGQGVVFTPNSNSYTAVNPNTFRYTVSVSGCTTTKDLNIYVKDNSEKPIITGLPSVVCPATNVSLSASVNSPGTYSFEWTKSGQLTPFATGATVNYTVTSSEVLQVRSVNSPFGCRSDVTLATINTPFSTGNIIVDKSLISPGDPVKFSTDAPATGNTFNWKFGDGSTSVEREPTHFFYMIGEFIPELTITSTLGCSQTIKYTKITVAGDPINVVTAIPVNKNVERIETYPNPVETFVNVISGSKIVFVCLTDLAGKEVNFIKSPGEYEFTIDCSVLPSGMYVMKLSGEKGLSVIKIFKK